MAVTGNGFPFMSQLACGSIHDARIFPTAMTKLINTDFHTDKQALLSAKRVRGDHLGAIFKRL